MLKYYDIINKLSDSDKIYILSDVSGLSDKKYRALGIPGISEGDLSLICSEEFPSPISMANSFDPSLVGEVADAAVKMAEGREIGFLRVPSPRIKINPYRRAISEDTRLAAVMSGEYLKAAKRGGIAAALEDFALYRDEIEWLDYTPSERAVSELVIKPYRDVAAMADCAAVFTREDLKNKEYSRVNSGFMDIVLDGGICEGAAAICERVDASNTVKMLMRKGIFFEGSSQLLESALARYKKLKRDIDHGNATTEELAGEMARGRAISPELIDEAVDRLLDLAFSVKRRANLSTVISDTNLCMRAIAESSVLLRNHLNYLPVRSGMAVSVIGDVDSTELCAALENRGYLIKSKERGYDLTRDMSRALLGGALRAAEDVDLIILFLGQSEEKSERAHVRRRLSLPANQQELLQRLGKLRRRVVAILPTDRPFDATPLMDCAAVICMPTEAKGCGEMLCRFICGEEAPSGRLASTVYTDTEMRYADHKTQKYRDGLKSGGFIGYRYYDTADIDVGFPFGHGLTYTHFSYSAISVKDGKVSFAVKNDGKRAGVEVAQVYIGANKSNVLRPRKELVAFKRIELGAGEKQTVELDIAITEVYCGDRGHVTESGRYTVYVGASVSDIRLMAEVDHVGEEIASDKKSISDYIYSRSNIISDNYKVEAKKKSMRKSLFNIVAGAVMLAMAIILKLYCASNAIHGGFFDFFAIALGVGGVAFFIMEAIRRSRIHSEERMALEKQSDAALGDAESIVVFNAADMFVKEFDASDDDAEDKDEHHTDEIDAEYLKYIDKTLTLKTAASELEIYAAERGVKLGADTAKKIFAALASSRLVAVTGMSEQSFNKLLLILSGYFETSIFVDKVDVGYNSGESLLFKSDSYGNTSKRQALLAMESARVNSHALHIAALTNVVGRDMPSYFASYIGYVKNPLGDHKVTVRNVKGEESSYYIPKNVWFFINLAEGEKADSLPDFVSEVATVNVFEIGECAICEQMTHVKKFSYYQMDYLCERTANALSVEEDVWKRIDHFEESINSVSPFHIGNKLWLCFERFAAAYIAAGGEMLDAIDEATAAKLIVPAASALREIPLAERKNLADTVETVFGEDRADACKKLIALCGSDRA